MEDQEVDISTKMRKRVKIGYGFDVRSIFPFSITSFSILHSSLMKMPSCWAMMNYSLKCGSGWNVSLIHTLIHTERVYFRGAGVILPPPPWILALGICPLLWVKFWIHATHSHKKKLTLHTCWFQYTVSWLVEETYLQLLHQPLPVRHQGPYRESTMYWRSMATEVRMSVSLSLSHSPSPPLSLSLSLSYMYKI